MRAVFCFSLTLPVGRTGLGWIGISSVHYRRQSTLVL